MKFILYLLKRIIIGVSIVLSVSFIKSLVVNADVDLSGSAFNLQVVYKQIGTTEQQFTTYQSSNFNGRPYLYNTFSGTTTGIAGSFWRFEINNQGEFNRIEFKTYTRSTQPTSAIIRIQGSADKNSYTYLTDEISCDISNNLFNTSSTAYIYSYYCDIPKIDYTYNYYRLFIYVNSVNPYEDVGALENTIYFGINRWLSVYNMVNNSTINSSIQEQTETQHQDSENTQQKIDEVNDTLNDNTTDNPQSSFESFNSSLPSNNTISNLITLPVQLFQKILNSLSSSCTPFNLGNLMGTNLVLPCINISNYIGSTLWNVIDVLFSGFFVLVIGRKMIKAFENFSSMKEGDVLND